ncbi:L,D-transpeptidase family protein [soil metagenome]
MIRYKRSFFLCLIILSTFQSKAQGYADKLRQLLQMQQPDNFGLQYFKEVKAFYTANSYRFSWLINQRNDLATLTGYILQATEQGLNKEDYQPSLFWSRDNENYIPGNEKDSLLAEIKYTDAAIHFFHDVLMGNRADQLSYNGVNYIPECYDLPALLNDHLDKGRFTGLLGETGVSEPGYLAIKKMLNLFQQKSAALHFQDATVTSLIAYNKNKPLLKRLFQLGLLASDTGYIGDAVVVAAVKEAQKLFDLLNDGKLRSTNLKALNVPLAIRIVELKNTLNSLRWLSCLKATGHVIIVNIPSATLTLYEHGNAVLNSRVIVGKKSTATPTLSAIVTEVILYPYWNVPYKIATQEILPRIRRNPAYLETNAYQVLNRNGKLMDPTSINWHLLSARNFPYAIRQSTGCDNALGLIKLNFYNPFSVYLHDTPGKSLFALNKRYFSHGCMRVEEAMELGHYILKDNAIAIDTLTVKGCLKSQSPVIVPATEKIPVFVIYHTAWPDPGSGMKFYEDVYVQVPRPTK